MAFPEIPLDIHVTDEADRKPTKTMHDFTPYGVEDFNAGEMDRGHVLVAGEWREIFLPRG